MDETPLYLAKEYHRELLETATKEHSENGVRHTLPSTRERMYLSLGNSLITLGKRLKNHAAPSMPVKMAEDCA